MKNSCVLSMLPWRLVNRHRSEHYLSSEILLQIFESYTVWEEKAFEGAFSNQPEKLNYKAQLTLVNLCLTCRRFCQLAQPLLYRTFVKHRSTGKGKGYVPKMALRRYVCTLFKRPDLAVYVQTVFLGEWRAGRSPHKVRYQFKKDAAAEYGRFITSSRSYQHLMRGTEDEDIVFALYLVRQNLLELHIELPGAAGEYIGSIIALLGQLRITTLRRRLGSYVHGLQFQDNMLLQRLLSHPSLKTLKLHSWDGHFTWGMLPFSSRLSKLGKPSNLETLVLKNCSKNISAVRHLLASCRALKEFVFIHDSRVKVKDYPSWTLIKSALDSQQESLRRIVIDCFWYAGGMSSTKRLLAYPPQPFAATSLRSYTALEHLQIQQDALLGYYDPGDTRYCQYLTENLPLSLKTLVLLNTRLEIVVPISWLLRFSKDVLASRLPNLQYIEIGQDRARWSYNRDPYHAPSVLATWLKTARNIGASVDVKLVVQP